MLGPEDTCEIFHYLLVQDQEQESSRMFSGAVKWLTLPQNSTDMPSSLSGELCLIPKGRFEVLESLYSSYNQKSQIPEK